MRLSRKATKIRPKRILTESQALRLGKAVDAHVDVIQAASDGYPDRHYRTKK
jgi:hypothetical protein